MIFLAPLLARFGTYIAIGTGVVVAFFAWDSSRVLKGERLERARIEKATDNAVKIGSGAARKSDSPSVRGRRDPTTRDD